MEPELIAYLKKISISILIAVVWLGITSIAAIAGDNGFIEGDITLGNIIFYIWLIVSLMLLVKLYKRVWRQT